MKVQIQESGEVLLNYEIMNPRSKVPKFCCSVGGKGSLSLMSFSEDSISGWVLECKGFGCLQLADNKIVSLPGKIHCGIMH